MKHIIQFKISKGERYYVAESIDLPIVTQGESIDAVLKNIQEAVALHIDGEDLFALDLVAKPTVLVNVELMPAYA